MIDILAGQGCSHDNCRGNCKLCPGETSLTLARMSAHFLKKKGHCGMTRDGLRAPFSKTKHKPDRRGYSQNEKPVSAKPWGFYCVARDCFLGDVSPGASSAGLSARAVCGTLVRLMGGLEARDTMVRLNPLFPFSTTRRQAAKLKGITLPKQRRIAREKAHPGDNNLTLQHIIIGCAVGGSCVV